MLRSSEKTIILAQKTKEEIRGRVAIKMVTIRKRTENCLRTFLCPLEAYGYTWLYIERTFVGVERRDRNKIRASGAQKIY
jgi:hypothetical protein